MIPAIIALSSLLGLGLIGMAVFYCQAEVWNKLEFGCDKAGRSFEPPSTELAIESLFKRMAVQTRTETRLGYLPAWVKEEADTAELLRRADLVLKVAAA